MKSFEDHYIEAVNYIQRNARRFASIGLVLFCGAVSIAGVAVSVARTHSAADGQRGGAIGTIFPLFIIFLSPSYASKLHAILRKSEKTDDPELVNLSPAERVLNLLDGDAKRAKTQSRWITGATVISTFFWGFGDCFAKAIMICCGIRPHN